MKVVLIASTVMDWAKIDDTPWVPYVNDGVQFNDYIPDADYLAEFAGRACYESWHRPNPTAGQNDTYLAHILEVGHESVLEHASSSVGGLPEEANIHLDRAYDCRSRASVCESGA